MAKKKVNISLPSVDELFTSQVERDSKGSSVIQLLPLASIVPFPKHPFGVRDDQDMEQLVESIQEHGILSPLAVRAANDGVFELISGHRRKHAAEVVGLTDVPCIVKDLTDDEAVIAMVDSNLQRETILPSERAFAYSMRLEAMKRQGFRSDLACAQFAHKSGGRKSRDILAEELGVSKDMIRRYIRLTNLIPGLLTLVDAGRMKMQPAIAVSYLEEDEQQWLLEAIDSQACTPSHAQAVKMRRYSEEGTLTAALVSSIMEEEKPNQIEQFKIPKKNISRFFKAGMSNEEMSARIIKALELLEAAEAKRDWLAKEEVHDG
ncbi:MULTISPECIES: ParB/RepB/Spo0J family partition protein [unclassified Adlercreutzia]|uniref:ParB/RepB/Spo0J family partition protein n=1 Tax=unclassified Adlercreutzia TaxID=2636013 RepID=UPI0013ECA1C8|nr:MULTISPECIES: ParB/RepB/Spo0J family partition protein [unclassified Adlercreutzia]